MPLHSGELGKDKFWFMRSEVEDSFDEKNMAETNGDEIYETETLEAELLGAGTFEDQKLRG